MKFLITGIVLLTIVIMSFLILNRNIYFTEEFCNKESSYNQNTIEDVIIPCYIPDNPYEKQELNEYEVIDIYKKILDRSPNANEIKTSMKTPKNKLMEDLYNSFEYDKLLKLQNNNANNQIEGAIAKRNLILKIMDIYKKTYKKNVPEKMILPLRDCYVHLASNYYLFLVMVESKNYSKFEQAVLSTIVLTKKVLLELFNKHFNLLELKLLAENRIKIEKRSGNNDSNKNKEENKLNVNELNSYINNPNMNNLQLQETYNTDMKDNTCKNNNCGEKNTDDLKKELSKLLKVREPEPEQKLKDDVIKNLPKDSELYLRIYDPINYKQTYRGPNDFSKQIYKPPICTSLGQPQLTTPIFTESKLLFQGTELDKAFAQTQVGSIMPKFIYREYQDVRIR
jgi:hypothetical protein